MRRHRGFTLMEAAVSLALVGVIAVAATSLYASVVRSFANARKTASLADRSQAAVEYLLKELRGVGGNGIPASAAIFVEDGNNPNWHTCGARGHPTVGYPDCQGNDRITTFTALSRINPCSILPPVGGQAANTIRVPRMSADYDGDGTPDCCFNDATNQFKRHVMLLKDQEFFRPVLLVSTAANSCIFRIVSDNVPPWMTRTPNFVNPGVYNGNPDAFAGGTAVVVEFKTIYVDPAGGKNDLIMHTEKDDNLAGTANTVLGERLFLMDHVYDFQVSLGYDISEPPDGRITMTVNGASDEWAFNSPAESALTDGTTTIDVNDAAFDIRRLRMVRTEFIVGMPTGGVGSGIPVYSPGRGTSIAFPGVALRAAGASFTPRNSDEFSLGGP